LATVLLLGLAPPVCDDYSLFIVDSSTKSVVFSFPAKLLPTGGNAMIGKNNLDNFKKMWTWLYGHPAHDREYYMRHVAKLNDMWENSCPLSTSPKADECGGCQMLWQSDKGTLCTDPDAPLYKWKNTDRQQPDDRSFYAGHVADLAMHLKIDQ
jgi:hypothetical protein